MTAQIKANKFGDRFKLTSFKPRYEKYVRFQTPSMHVAGDGAIALKPLRNFNMQSVFEPIKASFKRTKNALKSDPEVPPEFKAESELRMKKKTGEFKIVTLDDETWDNIVKQKIDLDFDNMRK